MKGWRIVSGGQTGVDRAALDAARELGLPYGGFVPKGRWTEDGPLPDEYDHMIETEARHPSSRTRRNIRQSDATLVITRGEADGGTLLTLRKARDCGKPLLHVDLARTPPDRACLEIRGWLEAMPAGTLNVAGPRASKAPGLYEEARSLLLAAFGADAAGEGDRFAAEPVRHAPRS